MDDNEIVAHKYAPDSRFGFLSPFGGGQVRVILFDIVPAVHGETAVICRPPARPSVVGR